MSPFIFELATVILVAACLSMLARFFRQPLILAYLATGILIGSFSFFNIINLDIFYIFSDLGIMFLLFLIGLEMNITSIKLSGKTSLIVGLGQIIFTFGIGFFIATLFNFNYLQAAYIAIALTFSSTIIIVKLLSEKNDLNSLYGRISIGFLLVQDFIAIIILLVLAGIELGNGIVWADILFTILKGIALFIFMFWIGRVILPKIFDKIARSQELLFLMTLAWVFLLVSFMHKIGFSIEIGGFLAGIALANSSENFQIASRIKPLRDFFILLFFVVLGSSIIFTSFNGLTTPIIIFSLFVLIGNPLIVLAIMGIMGYRKKTSFLAGVTVAQISEFSLILVALGLKLGHINEGVVVLVTAVGVITITLSTYMITYANHIFNFISPVLSIFERKKTKEYHAPVKKFKKPVVLIGYHRTGQSMAKKMDKKDFLVIDIDPDIIQMLDEQGIDNLLGDISDEEIFEKANIASALLVVSTNPNLEDNLTLISRIKSLKNKPKVIVRAQNNRESKALYEAGAYYVLLPETVSGHYLRKIVRKELRN